MGNWSNFLNYYVFISLKIVFILVNNADPDEMPPYIMWHFILQGSHEHWKTWKITKKFHAWKIMDFEKKLKNHGKIMEFCEIICVFDCLFSGYW